MLQLTGAELDMLTTLLPVHSVSPNGGRPPTDRRKAIAGIFWVLDNGAKWKDLPAQFGSKSAVHRSFTRWVKMGAFEALLAAIGSIVKERRGFKLYECHIDGTFLQGQGRRRWHRMHQGWQRGEDHDHGRRQRAAHRGQHRQCQPAREHVGRAAL